MRHGPYPKVLLILRKVLELITKDPPYLCGVWNADNVYIRIKKTLFFFLFKANSYIYAQSGYGVFGILLIRISFQHAG